jgi:tetratricopeptide (TPR) repeat protein
MGLQLSRIEQIETQGLGTNHPLERRFQLIKQSEERGDYEAALDAFGDLWEGVGHRPKTDGLSEPIQAELLLRAGTLTGWLGSARQIVGAQERAKDLITESARTFEGLGLAEKATEAQIDLAICYWREGGFDEARITLKQVLDRLGDQESEQRLRALLNSAIVEKRSNRYTDALRIHIESAPWFESSDNHTLRGNFHNEFAGVLKRVGLAEERAEYIDRAFIEYAAASYHFEQAGHTRYLARVENNLGLLLLQAGKLVEAHQHLNHARALFVRLRDKGSIAQVDDTRARVFLAEGLNQKAEMIARTSVRTLEQGDERSLLAEALTTHATSLARLGRHRQAFAELKRAMDVAQQAGDPDSGGGAALTIVEELSARLSSPELREYYRSADSLLDQPQHPGIRARLGQCARRILAAEDSSRDRTSAAPDHLFAAGDPESAAPRSKVNGDGLVLPEVPADSSDSWAGCSLEQEVLQYERGLIKRALETSGGSVTRAARLLGITHQGLAFILNGRHKSLLSVRTPIKSRRRSVFRYN